MNADGSAFIRVLLYNDIEYTDSISGIEILAFSCDLLANKISPRKSSLSNHPTLKE